MRNNRNKVLRVLATVLLTLTISTSFVIDAQASTVNDVRELLGRQRLEPEMLAEEIKDLTRQYLIAELNNVAAEMFDLGEEIKLESNNYVEQMELSQEIESKSDKFYEAFISNEAIHKVLELKTELDSTMSKVNQYRKEGYNIDVEFVPNRWTDIYKEVQKKVEEYDDSFDIGVVGGEMKSAVENRLEVSSPFGTRWDPIDKDRIAMHKGLDLNADMRQNILAQWNGIVINVYESKGYGKTVEIQHGKGLMTRYAHLDEQLVKIGDVVKQYDIIGLAGSTGRSTGPHLHLEVYVDDIIANPIMLYGKKGMEAYYQWVKTHPGAIVNDEDIKKIKDKATGNMGEDIKKEYTPGFYNPIPKEYSNTPENIPPGAIVPKLPDGYKRPEPGVLQ